MGIKDGAKKGVKFTFVDIPLNILGWKQLRAVFND